MRIDLHTHSVRATGPTAPRGLVRSAVDAGLDVVAITDHDTADGWAAASAAAVELGIELVPRHGDQHPPPRSQRPPARLPARPDYPPLAGELARVLGGRASRVPAMLQQLHRLGIDITEDDVRRASDGTAAPGRPHVADALATLGVVADRTEAFNRYLGAGKAAYIDRYAAPLEDTIRYVTEAGGVAVIAHPWGRGGLGRPDEATLAALKAIGLAGIEVDHQDHDAATRERLRVIARDLGLVATGSSDYHGAGKTDHELGCNTSAPEEYARLMELARAAAADSDRVTPAVVGR